MFDYKKIVMIMPERLGDTIFHTPSFRLLKKIKPDLEIDVIALSPLSASVLENNPYIHKIHVLPSKRETQALAQQYDVAMNVHNHAESRKYIGWLGIPSFTTTPWPAKNHQSKDALNFIKSLLHVETCDEEARYNLFPTSKNFEKIATILAENSVSLERDILIGCHIGCHSIAKRGYKIWRPLAHPKVWPFENFIALEAMLRNHNSRIRIVLTGSKSERALGEKFVAAAPMAINLIDKTSVLDLAALMERLALFVTSDTGAMHVACASSVGIVALFGPTSLERTGPYPMRDNYRILQSNQLDNITVAQVFETILTHPDMIALNGDADTCAKKYAGATNHFNPAPNAIN